MKKIKIFKQKKLILIGYKIAEKMKKISFFLLSLFIDFFKRETTMYGTTYKTKYNILLLL